MAKKKKPRAKRRVIGVMGKLGIMIMGGAPLVGAGAEAFNKQGQSLGGGALMSVAGRMSVGYSTFMNSLAKGFGWEEPFGNIQVKDTNGVTHTVATNATNTPTNVWWTTTGIGGLMLAQDRLIAFVLKRPVKVPGTNITFTGN